VLEPLSPDLFNSAIAWPSMPPELLLGALLLQASPMRDKPVGKADLCQIGVDADHHRECGDIIKFACIIEFC
jgi:hypothetical protein